MENVILDSKTLGGKNDFYLYMIILASLMDIISTIPGSVLFCMVVIMMTAILSITGAQNLFQAFDGNCIYACNISFVPRNENATAILNSTLSRTQTSSSKDNASVITSTTEAVTESSTTRGEYFIQFL